MPGILQAVEKEKCKPQVGKGKIEFFYRSRGQNFVVLGRERERRGIIVQSSRSEENR